MWGKKPDNDFFDTSEKYTPEQKLWLSVIERAVKDLCHAHPCIRNQAKMWLQGIEEEEGRVTAIWCADQCDLLPMLDKLKKLLVSNDVDTCEELRHIANYASINKDRTRWGAPKKREVKKEEWYRRRRKKSPREDKTRGILGAGLRRELFT